MATINPSAPINARIRMRSPLDYALLSREFAETPAWRQALDQIANVSLQAIAHDG
jgi:hypothetical protein